MNFFFEILAKQIGYSRLGRISLSENSEKYIYTPNIIVPFKSILLNQLNFLEFFEDHDIFIISKEVFLKIGFLREKFRNTGFIYTHTGALERFQEILEDNSEIFSEENIIALIPFNIPTTSVNKQFAEYEIRNYLENVKDIIKFFPNLRLGLSIRIFDYPELFNIYIPFIQKNDSIVFLNLLDLFDTLSNFRKVLKIIVQIKQELDNNLVLMASGRIIPKLYPILVYFGIDLIDSSYLLYLSSENFYDTIEYLLPIYKLKNLPCPCVACSGNLKNILENKYSIEKTELLLQHNLMTAKSYMDKIYQYLKTEDYRIFVEKSSFDDLNVISTLKVIDKEYFDILKFETPVTQERKLIKSLGPSSYYRPDFQEFRERTMNSFTPEPWTKLIIILPCSATKPYSESKSHKMFYKIIRKFPDFPDFQEIILTSPLGAIPRQLENIYPVNSYDISVTGDWDEEELTIASDMLRKIVKKFDDKIPIICHLPEGGYLNIINKTFKILQNKLIFTVIQSKTTSKESLKLLKESIENVKDQFKPNIERKNITYLLNTWTRKFVKIADYQFGNGTGMILFSRGIKTKRDRSNSRLEIFDLNTGKMLGRFIFKTGELELTLNGAEKLFPFENKEKIIVFDGTKIHGNTLFRPGIIEFSPNLIPRDHVFILDKNKEKLIGLAKMLIGSNYIKNSKSGRVAKVYEKIK